MMQRVTIAIPTYRRGPLLRRAIESALRQTYEGDTEILVVENPSDLSVEGEPTYAESICLDLADRRIRHVRNSRNLGMAGNWNKCIELATSSWVAILHDDDWLAPSHVELSLALAKANPDLKLIGCNGYIERMGSPEHPDKRPRRLIRAVRLAPHHFLLGNPMFASGVMMDRETALSLGGFDPAWFPTMDHLLWLRFSQACLCAKVQHPLMHYSIGDNLSLEPSTLISTISNDYKQRSKLIRDQFSNNFLLNIYSRIKPYREHVFLEKRFNIKIPIDMMIEKLSSAGWRPMPSMFRWTYFPIRLFMEALSLLLTRRFWAIASSQKR